MINEKSEVINPDYCDRIHYDKNNMPEGFIKDDILVFNFISLPSVLINTQYAKEIGGFDESLSVQDYYMWLKLSESYEIKYLPEITAHYRVHNTSMSNFSPTSCVLEESVMINKYRYFHQTSQDLKKVIAKNIEYSAVYLYQHKYPSAKKWLGIGFKLRPGIKSFLYYCSSRLGIPFSFFTRIKSLKGMIVSSR